jgi:hypothetical protein
MGKLRRVLHATLTATIHERSWRGACCRGVLKPRILPDWYPDRGLPRLKWGRLIHEIVSEVILLINADIDSSFIGDIGTWPILARPRARACLRNCRWIPKQRAGRVNEAGPLSRTE